MPATIIFDSKSEIPEHLQSEARETDGKFELDAAGVLKKNKELLGKNAALQTKVEETEAAKEAAEAQAAEWKGKAKTPAGQRLVAETIADLGEAAQAASLTKDELPGLKTAKEDLQKQIDGFAAEKTINEVAKALNFNNRFVLAAKDKGLKFEKVTEKQDGKDADVWKVISGDAKTNVADFLKSDDYFKEFAETFKADTQRKTGNTSDPPPTSGNEAADKAAQTAMAQGIRNSF